MVFKGAECKEAVIRCITYDLLFNNMKSIVVKTSSQYTATRPPLLTITHTTTFATPLPIDELKKRYEKVAKKVNRRNGVVSSKGIDCSLKEHRARWKRMDELRLVKGSLVSGLVCVGGWVGR